MTTEQIAFHEPAMRLIFERFKIEFSPGSAKSKEIAQDVKWVVWGMMIYAFHPLVRPREIRLHFLKSFHPDTGTDVLTASEKTKIAAMAGKIFESAGEKQ